MPDLPPEAWNVIFKSGNAWAIILSLIAYRQNETLAKLKTDFAVLKATLKVKDTGDGDS